MKNKLVVVVGLLVLLFVVFQFVNLSWTGETAFSRNDLEGGKIHARNFVGAITEQKIFYNLYLPKDYQSSGVRYPVIYHLHGLDCDEFEGNTAIVEALQRAIEKEIIDPLIIVFPRGYGNAFWADSYDGKKPGETHVIRELIPHVDATYRTIANRSHRIIEGMSMGGFGAVEYAAKFPDLFCACVNYDGALLTWEMLQIRYEQEPSLNTVKSEIFGSKEEYFQNYSPWFNMTDNADRIRGKVAFLTLVGSLGRWNESFREHLLTLDIEPEYIQTKCGHDLKCMTEEQWEATFSFIARQIGS